MGASLYDTFQHSVGSLFGNDKVDSFPYKESVLGFMYIVFLWEEYLRFRHYRNLRSNVRPKALTEYVTEEEFLKAQAYGLDKARFGFIQSVFSQIENTLIITLEFMPWLWNVSGDIMFKVAGFGSEYEPLFNKFETLPDGELRTRIEALASRIQFPLTKLFVIDGSKRSGHSNAYFYGFLKNKRIVLYDTLLEHSDNDEICAVLAHELGHWACSHNFRMILFGQVQLFLIFYLFSQFINDKAMYASFGFVDATPTLIGFLLFNYLYSPVESVIGFITNIISRYHEYQADAFARDLGYAASLASGLIKLQLKNLGTMNPDWLHSMYYRSHPELIERLNAINHHGVGSKVEKVE
ncbi:hypothetical protein BGZ46_007098 [Entomortierella lignicola]|nr:hypothetical protein BGZ46_007098 [Entomortierella lignicola]KAF9204884.1 hypothetical protein BGZ49_004751 [Haplosporangium sp. Z 27]